MQALFFHLAQLSQAWFEFVVRCDQREYSVRATTHCLTAALLRQNDIFKMFPYRCHGHFFICKTVYYEYFVHFDSKFYHNADILN